MAFFRHNAVPGAGEQAMEPIELLVADQRTLLRQLLCQELRRVTDMVVCAEATSVTDAEILTQTRHPRVAIASATLAGGGGAEACKRIRESRKETSVLIVSAVDRDVYLASAWSAGASGFLIYESSVQDVISAIRQVASGSRLFTQYQVQRIWKWQHKVDAPLRRLTTREHEILALLVAGLTNGEIASELTISTKTVECHMTHIFAKLGVPSRSGVIAWLRHAGVLTTLLHASITKNQGVSPM